MSESRPELKELRRLLRAEAKALSKELDRLTGEQRKRLVAVEKKLENASDRLLLSDLAALQAELSSIRRGLGRLALVTQDLQKLKNEWHDWERHGLYADGEHPLREERQEMIASELRIRGARVPKGMNDQSIVMNAPQPTLGPQTMHQRTEEPKRESREVSSIIMIEEDQEERALQQALAEQRATYWDELVSGLDPTWPDTNQLARLLKAFRMAQGEQKLLDRQRGVRRYRLTAFEAWH
jgi:hypothetical protein